MALDKNTTPLICGCGFVGGRTIQYVRLRAHFGHIEDALENAAASLLYLELISIVNHDEAVRQPLADLRTRAVACLFEYKQVVRPALDKRFPPHHLADVLGL